jgi:hypothetical protein
MKKLTFILIACCVLGFIFWKWFFNQPCLPPEKPKNVPIEAIWKGGCDGGNWIELVSIENEKVRFRIYRDWNGELILDADFIYKDCNTFRLTKLNWSKQVAYFGNDIEFFTNTDTNKRCRLEPVYPAYFEEKLD